MAKRYIENWGNPMHSITWHALSKAPETIQLPFILHLTEESEPLICEEIIRYLPKKRLVLFGRWNNKEIVIKLFLQPGRAHLQHRRERVGLKNLAEYGILTPALLFSGTTKEYKIPILITEKITNAEDLEQIWRERSSSKNIYSLMKNMVIELATHHVMGIYQRDLHLKNFLIKNNKIYVLDGSQIDFFQNPLNIKMSLKHLALFFSQLGAGTHSMRQNLFILYCQSRGWQLKPSYFSTIEKNTQKYLYARLKSYRQKVLRNTSQIKKIVSFTKKIYFNKHFEFESFKKLLNNPKIAFQADANYLKKGRSATVVKYPIHNQTVVIKRYNIKNIFHGLRRLFRPTRAQKSWQYAHLLTLAGVPTAQPIACIERHFLGYAFQSYFIMEYISHINLTHYFSELNLPSLQAQKMAKHTIAILNQLAELRMSHGDLKATNFLIHKNQPFLIDLDGMMTHLTKRETQQAFQKEIKRFQKNWNNLPRIQKLFVHILENKKIAY